MKSLHKLLFSLICLLPAMVFAADDGQSFDQLKLLLKPTDGDKSLGFLATMFGQVDGVLHGGGSLILGAMLGKLNSAFLILGSVVLAYILIVSTVNTAHEGEALGKKWSSIWVPVRLAMSITLLIPKATGYSLVQVLVMWIVVQGVGLADSVWSTVLDYLQAGRPILQKEAVLSNSGYGIFKDGGAGNLSTQLLKAQVCMYKLENLLNDSEPKPNPPLYLASTVKIATSKNDSGNYTNTLDIPGTIGNTEDEKAKYRAYQGACGRFTWTGTERTNEVSKIAVNQVRLNTLPMAKTIYNMLTKEIRVDGVDFWDVGINTAILNGARDYMGILSSIAIQSTPQRINWDTTKNDGWLMAGSYFTNLVSLDKGAANVSASLPNPTLDNAAEYSTCSNSNIMMINTARKFICDPAQNTTEKVGKWIEQGNKDIRTYINGHYLDVAGLQAQAKQMDQAFRGVSGALEYAQVFAGFIPGGALLAPLKGLLDAIFALVQGFIYLDKPDFNIHPIISLKKLGQAYMMLGANLFGFGVMGAGIGAALGAVPAFNPIGFIAVSITTLLSGLITPLGDYLYVIGGMLAYYLPLIPTIIFTFGILGWLVAILESVISAPIVALGIASPGAQNELLGRAEPAMMLLLNIFLRPTLMIIGFVMGIVLSAIGIWVFFALLNFSKALGDFWLEDSTFSPSQITLFFVYLLVLSTVMVTSATVIFQRSFSLIHILPNNIMRWLAGGAQASFGSEFQNADSEVKQGVEGYNKATSGGLKGFSDSAMAVNRNIEANRDRRERGIAENRKQGASIGATQIPPSSNEGQG